MSFQSLNAYTGKMTIAGLVGGGGGGDVTLDGNNDFTGVNSFADTVNLNYDVSMIGDLTSANGDITLTNGKIRLTNGDIRAVDALFDNSIAVSDGDALLTGTDLTVPNANVNTITFEDTSVQSTAYPGSDNFALLDSSNTFSAANNYFAEINPQIVTATTSISTPEIEFPTGRQNIPYLGIKPTTFVATSNTPITVNVNSAYAPTNTVTNLTVTTPTEIEINTNYLVNWVSTIYTISTDPAIITGDLGIWTIYDGVDSFKYLGIPVFKTATYAPNFTIDFTERIAIGSSLPSTISLGLRIVDATTVTGGPIQYQIAGAIALFTLLPDTT